MKFAVNVVVAFVSFGSMQLNRQRMRQARLDSSDQEPRQLQHLLCKDLARRVSLLISMETARSADQISPCSSAIGAEPARATSTTMEPLAGQTLLRCSRLGRGDWLASVERGSNGIPH